MFKKTGLGFLVFLILFVVFVSSREGKFNYERSGVIAAPADKIFPYLIEFKKGTEWSPYDRLDPQMDHNYKGVQGVVGSSMEFKGNRNVGSGKLELLKAIPNESVEIKLTMNEPFHAENLVVYTLSPDESGGTKFTWSMSGDGGFMGKLINLFIDCEKMVGDQFSEGVNNLKTLVESQK